MALVALAAVPTAGLGMSLRAQATQSWPIHSLERPQPSIVNPGPPAPALPAPSDAIVLFDGRDLSGWHSTAGGPARWRIADGAMEVGPGTGDIATVRELGDVQLHIEWATPAPPAGTGQDRGNSGVYLMGLYEIQVLDSYRNPTYPDGQAGAIYGQFPPRVNASRAPGEWQSYDIVFHGPRFDANGKLLRPARMTVFHNGVLVHDDVELTGPTAHRARPPYTPHAERLPLRLQDHGQPVRFRNIWARELDGS